MNWWQLSLFLSVLLQKSSNFGANGKDAKIQSGLFENGEERQDAVVGFGSLQEMKDLAYQVQSQYPYATKEERIYAMYEAFHDYHAECTEEAASYLDEGDYTYHSLWSSNTMVIRNADPDCIEKLSKMNDVHTIGPVQSFQLIDPVENQEDVEKQLNKHVSSFFTHLHSAKELLDTDNTPFSPMKLKMTWGLDKIYVPEAWEYGVEGYYYDGKEELMNGQGIVVANIDTGVMAEHEALKDNHRTYAGWADGYNISDTPVDLHGHGTHTMSTICGSHGVGVAPGAQWIACRGCMERGCETDALLFCCNWIICPHDMSQKGPDDYKHCSTAPDLVSNSWGGGQGDHTFERCAIALRTAGIIPVWAHGNSGPECSTANSPGDLPMVIGVGACDKNDNLADFSSRGPTTDGGIKPDVSAPGVEVTGAWPTGPNVYVSISGTSMATPHVAGLVALMLQRCRLSYDTILNILQTTAEREHLGTSDQVCGGTTPDKFPNNFYGYGRVNALDAIKKVLQTCKYKNYGGTEGYGNQYNSGVNTNYGSGGGYSGSNSGTGAYSSSYPSSYAGVGYNKRPYQSSSTYAYSSSSLPVYAGRSGGSEESSKTQPYSYSYSYQNRRPYYYNNNNNYGHRNPGYRYNSYNIPIVPYNRYGHLFYRG